MESDKSADPPKFITIAAPRDLANRIRVVAAHRGITMTDVLEKFLRPALEREYRKCVAEASADLGGGEG